MLPIYFFLYKLRFLFSGILVILAALLLISAAVPQTLTAQARSNSAATASTSDIPAAVTHTMVIAAYEIKQTTESTLRAAGKGIQTAADAVGRTSASVAHAVQIGTVTVAKGVGNGVMFIIYIPNHIISFLSPATAVNAIIKPADHNQVPIIDPESPALLAAKEALPAIQTAEQAAPQTPIEAIWPMHGQVTTQFGEHGWAYETVHTGIDISDGKYGGNTPIVPFRSGKVITAERSGGLGNHVVVDHGSGVTSVYGHLSSITVQIGQTIDTKTTLGYEGSTGVSTGPHLHFEIRVDGQATDPRQFISGQP